MVLFHHCFDYTSMPINGAHQSCFQVTSLDKIMTATCQTLQHQLSWAEAKTSYDFVHTNIPHTNGHQWIQTKVRLQGI